MANPMTTAVNMKPGAFQACEREHCWLHESAPVWIVFYENEEQINGGMYQAYHATVRVPKGRMPWTVDNKRIGNERHGFRTFTEAEVAANDWIRSQQP